MWFVNRKQLLGIAWRAERAPRQEDPYERQPAH